MPRARLFRVRLLALAVLAGVLLGVPLAHGAASTVVIGQLYASGGNSGASFTNDYVQLFNRGSAPADLTGWTIQYAPAAGTSWQATALSGSIQPGGSYLVQLASAAAVGAALPTPDATGTTNLAASGGKVALVADTAPLPCGAAAGSCSAVASVEDLVGWGSATDFEGAGAAPALTGATALVRAGGGCTDSGSSTADFSTAAPVPHNSASPVATCGGSAPPPSGGTAAAGVDVEIQPVLSIALERPTLSFGTAAAADTPAPLSERVTVVSNDTAGYALTVHRSAFVPADLPLGVTATAPAGGQLGPSLGAGLAPIPVAPAPDLLVGSSAGASVASGDVWPSSVGFSAPLPAVGAGRYTATVTFTVIGR